jgi:hypothetical protein
MVIQGIRKSSSATTLAIRARFDIESMKYPPIAKRWGMIRC